jgi:excisionase family DNA binding protein
MDIADTLRALVREEVRAEIRKVLDQAQSPEYLTTSTAADFAKLSEATIRRWVRRGKLASFRAGRELRVLRSDLERVLKDDAANDSGDSPELRAARDFR